jgi:hypothetical protein
MRAQVGVAKGHRPHATGHMQQATGRRWAWPRATGAYDGAYVNSRSHVACQPRMMCAAVKSGAA